MPTVTDAWLDAHRVDPAALADAPLVGLGHVEAELASLAARLASPELALRMGAEVPRGILLHGPAGIGKTHAARNLARRLGGVPAYEVVADELTGPVVRELFAALGARHRRCALLLDEVDLVGAERSESDAGTRRVLAALLTALDGLRTAAGVLVVASSSRAAWELDAALLRPGRIGFTIEIGYPDEPGREALLRHFLDGRPVAGEPDLAAVAAATRGYTPAALRALCADAAGLALADGRDAVAERDLRSALEREGRVVPQRAPAAPVDRAALRRVCGHEAGHLVAGAVLHGAGWLRSVDIGPSAGQVAFGPGRPAVGDGGDDDEEPGAEFDERALRASVAVALAGTAAERLLLGGATLSHAGDVSTATRIARRLVAGGSDPAVPPLDYDDEVVRGSPASGRAADAVAAMLAAARDTAASLVAANRGAVADAARWLEELALEALAADPRAYQAALDTGVLRGRLEAALGPGAPARRNEIPGPRAA